eukprot:5978883-Amphidinium_carterae.1
MDFAPAQLSDQVRFGEGSSAAFPLATAVRLGVDAWLHDDDSEQMERKHIFLVASSMASAAEGDEYSPPLPSKKAAAKAPVKAVPKSAITSKAEKTNEDSEPSLRAVLLRMEERLERLEQNAARKPPTEGWGHTETPLLGDAPKVSPQTIQKLKKKVGAPPPRLDDGPLAEEAGADEDDEVDGILPQTCNTLSEVVQAQMLQNQTKLLMTLASKKDDPMKTLLGGAEDDSKVSGARGCAARQLMLDHMSANPEVVYQSTRKLLAKALRKDVKQLNPEDMLEFFESRVPFGSQKGIVYTLLTSSAICGPLWRKILTQVPR